MTAYADALRRTLAPLERARLLPRAAHGPEGFALDSRVFAASWLPVCHVSELERPGSWVATESFGERLLAVRGADLIVRAFFDRCPHRGVPLTEGVSGRAAQLELACPYHGLRFGLDGASSAESARRIRLAGGPHLEAARVAEWGSFVLVSSGTPRPVEQAMGEAPPWLERAELGALRLARRTSHEVRAGWKLLVDNFQESLHFPDVHPSLEGHTPRARSASLEFGGAWLGGRMSLEAQTVSERGERAGRALVAAPGDRCDVWDALLFPAWLTSLQPDYLLSYRLEPMEPALTRVVAEVFVHAGTRPGDSGDVLDFWERTNAEDRAIVERQQRGVGSPTWEPGRYSAGEDGVHAFDRRVAAAHLELLGEAP